MSSFFSLEIKKLFFNNLSDIIVILIFLVAILFLVFSIMHLLKKRKNLIDDTVPYLVHLKETLDELIKEADELKKELTAAKLSASGGVAVAEPNTAALSGLQTMVDEKSHEISKLKEEIKKYETLEKDRNKTEPKESSDNSVELNGLKEENNKLKAQLEETERQAASGTVNTVDLEKSKDENDKLKSKLSSLETKIAEYEIIEDDLANLKILKEENEKLKGQIEELRSVVDVASEPSTPTSESPKIQESVPAAVLATPVENANDEDLQSEIDNVLQQFDTEMQKEANANKDGNKDIKEKSKDKIPAGILPEPTKEPLALKEEAVDPDLLKEFGLDPSDISTTPISVPAPVEPEPVSVTAPVIEEQPVVAEVISAEPVKTEKKEIAGDNIEGKLAEEFEKFMAENH